MTPRLVLVVWSLSWAFLTSALGGSTAGSHLQPAGAYRIHSSSVQSDLGRQYSAAQLDILERLNRADRGHLGRLRELVVPERWLSDELAHSVMPAQYVAAAAQAKVLVVHLPGQMFGAYEHGTLVRWGPVSSGGRATPTQPGLFSLNWKAAGRTSTVNPDWFMRWYFNVESQAGVAFHAYALPGKPQPWMHSPARAGCEMAVRVGRPVGAG